MSKISELSDGGSLVSSDYLIAVRSGGNVKVRMDQINVDQVDLGDNEFIRLGNSQDLTMVHTSTQSIINQAGIGDLLIQKAGATKLTINATGIDVTGTVTADGVDSQLSGSGGLPVTSGTAQTYGSLRVGATSFNTILDMGSAGASGAWLQASDKTALGTNYPLLLNPNGGNVGIGTSSPNLIGFGTGTNGLEIADATLAGIRLNGNAADSMYLISGAGKHWVYGRGAVPMTFSTNGAEAMRISSGNLLVGKTAIDSNTVGFQVDGGSGKIAATVSGAEAARFVRTTSDGEIVRLVKDTATVGQINARSGDMVIGTGDCGLIFNDGTPIFIPANVTTNAVADASIDLGYSAGRFKDLYLSGGINLNTASTAATITMARGTNSHNNMMKFSTGGTDDWIVGQRNDGTSDFRFYSYGTSNDAVSITRTGNLLVGTTVEASATSAGMSVNNSGYINTSRNTTSFAGHHQFFNTNGLVGIISTTGSATTYATSSDQRLKENIADADDAGSKIDAIQVRKFDWKADGSHQEYGMVAQELLEVAPEAVSAPEDPEEMMGVDYSKLVPMMLKEIQSLRARIAALES